MKFSLKAVALGALLASAAVAAPVDVEKRDSNSDRIAACFVGQVDLELQSSSSLVPGPAPARLPSPYVVNLGLIKTITINQMSMDFTPANPWAPTTSSNSIVSTMLSIPGITLPIDSIRQHIILSDDGVQIGSIETPWAAASVNGGTLKTSFPTSVLSVFPTSKAAFSKFVGSLSAAKSKPVTLQGAVDAKLNLGIFGHLTIPGIGFKVNTPFQGLNGLTDLKFMFMIDYVNDFQTNLMTMTTIVNVKNPSNLSLKLGDISFDTVFKGEHVGYSTIKNLSLVPGDNFVVSTTVFDNSLPACTAYFGTLANGDGPLDLLGYSGTSKNIALNGGLGALKSTMIVPKNFMGAVPSQAPYKDWSIKILPTTKTDGLVDITATFQSPYYGHSFEMVSSEPEGQDNNVMLTGVTAMTEGMILFEFGPELSFKVGGTGSVTKTFKVSLQRYVAENRKNIEDIVNFADANGYLPVNLGWMADGKIDGESIAVPRLVDWGTTGTLLSAVKIATGKDFKMILDSVPSA
ncbi:hypothetical protein BG005_009103 [Podila minutissima]|nr:hypothetical protein BG005_009103 [Podila minutissima]